MWTTGEVGATAITNGGRERAVALGFAQHSRLDVFGVVHEPPDSWPDADQPVVRIGSGRSLRERLDLDLPVAKPNSFAVPPTLKPPCEFDLSIECREPHLNRPLDLPLPRLLDADAAYVEVDPKVGGLNLVDRIQHVRDEPGVPLLVLDDACERRDRLDEQLDRLRGLGQHSEVGPSRDAVLLWLGVDTTLRV